MELRDIIKKASEKAGSLSELARMLNLQQQTVSAAKAHKRPLPADACVKLADFLKIDLKLIIAAND